MGPLIFNVQPRNFYPRSPCGERPAIDKLDRSDCGISIHALLAESDVKYALSLLTYHLFLSTLSLRRATNREKRKYPEQ